MSHFTYTFPLPARTATEIRDNPSAYLWAFTRNLLSSAELTQPRETNREMTPERSVIRDAAADMKNTAEYILRTTKSKPAKAVKPTPPKLNGVQISVTANGFMVEKPMTLSESDCIFRTGPTLQAPHVFETFESLAKWLRNNIARPDKTEAAK